MKAVLMSIKPQFCELIANGKKTVEVRKTKPKLDTPFKVYIYMTQGDAVYPVTINDAPYTCSNVGGQCVIGEFVCDRINDIKPHFDKPNFCNQYLCDWKWGEGTACLSFSEMNEYLNGKNGYGWHISDLVIYDSPKSLGEYNHCGVNYHFNPTLTRPPQSWCYVEEQNDRT
jgi:predicted transcriptional regulator